MRQTRKAAKSKKSNPLLLQTFWTGNPLSRLERAALQSYVNQGYTVDLYTYNPLAEFKKRIPGPGIRVHDANEILPSEKLFQYKGRAAIGKREDAYAYLPFSDLFRFTMLHKNGGAWIDLDVFLTRPIPASILAKPYVFSAERTIQKGAYKKKEPEVVDMGFFKVPGPGDPLMSWILERVPNNLLELKTPFDYMTLYRKGIAALGLERYVLPAEAFLPLNWWDVKESFAPGAGDSDACYPAKYGTAAFCVAQLKRRSVYGVHWFRAILRKRGLLHERKETEADTTNLYERMIAAIEDQGGLRPHSL